MPKQTGTKRARRDVAQPMSNANATTRRNRIARVAKSKRARKVKGTLVVVPQFAPWLRPANLDVDVGLQRKQLELAMRDVHKMPAGRSLSMQVHGAKCPWSVVLWPRASECANPDVDEAMRHALDRRDAECNCTPLVMYTGALA